jgi:membrane protein implicated in regulation of membrane protease activity
MSEKQHPGINMHNLPVGGGFAGLVFAAGSALIFLVGFPSLWYFLAFSVVLGIAIALGFRFISRRGEARRRPLSILAVREEHGRAGTPRQNGPPNQLRIVPTPVTA